MIVARLTYFTTTRARPRFRTWACGLLASPCRWDVARSTGKQVAGVENP
jgi:hypothetical protein